ncbi:hypothetical protein HDU98_011660 [Podochytrium sp. JEL0797]|nr:hypothetical protein HDU98_011660 [Podochytrium sp. JEL0797]
MTFQPPLQPSLADLYALLTQVASDQTRMKLDFQAQIDRLASEQQNHHVNTGSRLDTALSSLTESLATESCLSKSRFDALQTSLTTIESQIAQQSQTTTQNAHKLSLQILQLQNPTKKHYRRFTSLPTEVVAQILSLLDPKHVWQLRRLSQAFRTCISTPAFARLNLVRFLPAPDVAVVESCEPTEDQVTFLKAPLTYQTAYIQRYWKNFKDISWDGDENDLLLDIEVPIALMGCKHLVSLELQCCFLTGAIPDEIGLLQGLELLSLVGNTLEGVIPAGIGKLKKLKELYLAGNQLSGPIPAEIGLCCSLTTLGLWRNETLNGPLPRELGNLANLSYLDLSQCAFTGPIPEEFGRLANLEKMFLSCNLLSGDVPVGLKGLQSLREVDFQKNPGLVCLFDFNDEVEFSI